jgi:hypothetical protein
VKSDLKKIPHNNVIVHLWAGDKLHMHKTVSVLKPLGCIMTLQTLRCKQNKNLLDGSGMKKRKECL